MSATVAVQDAAQSVAGADFPPLKSGKTGREPYRRLSGGTIAGCYWRADSAIAPDTAIDRTAQEKMTGAGPLIHAGNAGGQADRAAVAARGVELPAFPDADFGLAAAVDHYIRSFEH